MTANRPFSQADLRAKDAADPLNWTRGEFELPSAKECGGTTGMSLPPDSLRSTLAVKYLVPHGVAGVHSGIYNSVNVVESSPHLTVISPAHRKSSASTLI